MKKLLAVILSTVMLATGMSIGAFAADGVDYTVTNPYATVNWNTYKQYKADLHAHTTASDGDQSKSEQIERHYELGYDIMSLNDHGTVDYGWDQMTTSKTMRVFTTIKEGVRELAPLGATGVAANGLNYTYQNELYTQYDESGKALRNMLRAPMGNEQNPTSFNNAHVNSWFVDYGNDVVGGTSDYETPIKMVDSLGGLSVINHPGEYSNARDEQYIEDAYDMDNIHYKYVVNKFANLLTKYDSCLGIDINSKGDYRTRFDRKLWDLLLGKVIPTGRNVYAIATSDSHNPNIVNSGYTLMCMPELTQSALRASMETGAFFAASRYIGSTDELNAWITELTAAGNAPELTAALKADYEAILVEQVDDTQDTVFEFEKDATAPKVTSINVDDNDDTITINTKDAYMVHWIADGEFIATGNTIDLDDYSDKIGSYVRAEIIGEGGVIYTQAFMLDYDGAPEAQNDFFVDLGYPATLICDTIVRVLGLALKAVGFIDLIYYFVK